MNGSSLWSQPSGRPGQEQPIAKGRVRTCHLISVAGEIARRIGVMSTTTKPFDYSAFIDELGVLRDSYANPPSDHRTRDSLEFKQWRHQVSDLIDRIEAKGYDINCRISSRQFRVMTSAPISPREQQAAFDKAHAETMIELNTIIGNFEKYGDPKATPPAQVQALSPHPDVAPKQMLEWDKEATLMWYLKNTPAATLWGFGVIVFGLIGGAILLGITIEKRWPEAKPPVVADPASMVLPPESQRPAASQPASAGLLDQPPIGGQPTSNTKVQPPLNGQPLSGQGKP